MWATLGGNRNGPADSCNCNLSYWNFRTAFPLRAQSVVARRASVEHPFSTIKQWMGQGAFLTRRLNNVRGEFSLTALAYNMRRAINLVGVPALVAAATA